MDPELQIPEESYVIESQHNDNELNSQDIYDPNEMPNEIKKVLKNDDTIASMPTGPRHQSNPTNQN